MPAPVRIGAMSMSNSFSTISTATLAIAIVATAADERAERAGALATLDRVERRALTHLVLEAPHEQRDECAPARTPAGR